MSCVFHSYPPPRGVSGQFGAGPWCSGCRGASGPRLRNLNDVSLWLTATLPARGGWAQGDGLSIFQRCQGKMVWDGGNQAEPYNRQQRGSRGHPFHWLAVFSRFRVACCFGNLIKASSLAQLEGYMWATIYPPLPPVPPEEEPRI